MDKLFKWCKTNINFAGPLIIALFSVLFLFANNLQEYTLQVIITPLIIAIVFSLAVLFISKLIFKKIEVASVVASVFIFESLAYSRLLELFKNNEVLLLVVLVVFLAGTVYLCLKHRDNLLNINKLLVFVFSLLSLMSLFNIVNFEIRAGKIEEQPKPVVKKEVKQIKYDGPRPDIYYFILDRYGGQKGLREQYGFDNSKFLNYLSDKGFHVMSDSKTNYPKTFLSLSSSLNMEYLDSLTEQTNGGESGKESIATPLIQDSKVLNFLRERGYKYYNVGSWWQQTKINPNADENFYYKPSGYFDSDEFTTGYLNTTIAAPILKVVTHNPIDVSQDPWNNLHRQSALYEFKTIPEVAKLKGPKFVFAHILLPHDPFVFDKNCNPIPETVVNKNTNQVNYVNQVQCANKKFDNMINQILKNSKTPPVIIFQADEGPFPMNSPISKTQEWDKGTDVAFREKFPILNAYYFPGVEDTNLYETITPVNTFRVLFNNYFGTNYELLPDKNFIFIDQNNYYKFRDVTDIVK